jgi:bifunctional UDP-N-acetylglucosamine pyrophosphorylase/glucosamine-1-phosphate N-acetyltransferase
MKATLNIAILAAGRGKRMVSRLPKVLQPLAGRPLIAHVVETARALIPEKICVVYGYGGERVPQAVGASDITFVKQAPQLGTGHALQQALSQLGNSGVTLVLYGDVPLVRRDTLLPMIDCGTQRVSVLTAELDQPAGYGRILRDTKGHITGIVEEKDASAAQRGIREVNTGIMTLPTVRLAAWLGKLKNHNAQGEYYLTDVIALALADGVAVSAVNTRDVWETLGANSRRELARLERVYQQQCATRLLDQGVTLADPMRIDVRGNLKCGVDVLIDVNCVFEGDVTLGDRVEIGANCVLRSVEIGQGTRIEPFSHVDGAKIDGGCRIGPYARIRPGTRLARDVHIGNFVEVKASEIGAGSKANHLAYVGDATVGRKVNIGAGTITCNYDGANKHRTVIEDNVHIGSDVQLVAPVTVGTGATIGAGATITRDVLPGELTFTKKEQVTKPGWKRPKKQERRKQRGEKR